VGKVLKQPLQINLRFKIINASLIQKLTKKMNLMLNWKNKLKMKKKIGCLERSVKNSKLTKIIIKIKKLLKKMDWMIIMTLIINKIKVFNYNSIKIQLSL
jgi:hypothetical protein